MKDKIYEFVVGAVMTVAAIGGLWLAAILLYRFLLLIGWYD